MNINNNDTNNQDRQDPSEWDVGHVAPEDQATLRHSASSTESTNSSSSSRPMSSADRVRALAHDQEDEAVPHPDEGLTLSSDRVSAACLAGAIVQTRQKPSSLAGIAQGKGQTLVSAIVANPRAGASGVAYHLTVPPRYLELGDTRRELHISGKFGEAAVAARDAYLARYYPEIEDNNWRDHSGQIGSHTNFADYSRARRLELIQQQEAVDHGETQCPMFTWTWSDALEGQGCSPQRPADEADRSRRRRGDLDVEVGRRVATASRRDRPSPARGASRQARS